MHFIRDLILCCSLCLGSANAAEHIFAIVTAAPPPETPLSVAKAKLIYSGKVRSIPGIGKIELIDLPSGHTLRIAFYQQFLNKSEAQMSRIWASLAFSGRAHPPQEFESDNFQALRQWLTHNPTTIGYLPIEEVGGLNVLLEVH